MKEGSDRRNLSIACPTDVLQTGATVHGSWGNFSYKFPRGLMERRRNVGTVPRERRSRVPASVLGPWRETTRRIGNDLSLFVFGSPMTDPRETGIHRRVLYTTSIVLHAIPACISERFWRDENALEQSYWASFPWRKGENNVDGVTRITVFFSSCRNSHYVETDVLGMKFDEREFLSIFTAKVIDWSVYNFC